MYCVVDPARSPTVVFETTVRSWPQSGRAAAAIDRARTRRWRPIIGSDLLVCRNWRVSPCPRRRLLADRLAEVELSRRDVGELGDLSRRPSDRHAVRFRPVAEAEEEPLRPGGEKRVTGRHDLRAPDPARLDRHDGAERVPRRAVPGLCGGQALQLDRERAGARGIAVDPEGRPGEETRREEIRSSVAVRVEHDEAPLVRVRFEAGHRGQLREAAAVEVPVEALAGPSPERVLAEIRRGRSFFELPVVVTHEVPEIDLA